MNEVNRPRKPLLIFYIAVLLILFLWNSMIVPMVAEQEIKEVDYGTFMTMTEQKDDGQGRRRPGIDEMLEEICGKLRY